MENSSNSTENDSRNLLTEDEIKVEADEWMFDTSQTLSSNNNRNTNMNMASVEELQNSSSSKESNNQSTPSKNDESPTLKKDAENAALRRQLANLTSNNMSIFHKKGRGRPRKDEDDLTWPKDITYLLIDLWKERELLYNSRHPLYQSKYENEKAMIEIQESLSRFGFVATLQQIHNKLKYLRYYYCRERSRNQHRHQTSSSTSGKWRLCDNLEFLGPYISFRSKTLYQMSNPTNPTIEKGPSHTSDISHQSNAITTTNISESLVDVHIEPIIESVNSMEQRDETESEELIDQLSSGDREESDDIPVSITGESPVETLTSTANNISYENKSKSDDDIFIDLFSRMIKKVPDGPGKEMLKLAIQQMIIQATYSVPSANNFAGYHPTPYHTPSNIPFQHYTNHTSRESPIIIGSSNSPHLQ